MSDTAPVPPSKKLLDTGPSEHGWHSFERFLRCALIHYWHKCDEEAAVKAAALAAQATTAGAANAQPPPRVATPLAKGTIGHVGLAHYYARVQKARRGESVTTVLSPREAMITRAESLGRLDLLPGVSETVRGYIDHYGLSDPEIVSVESPMATEMKVPSTAASTGSAATTPVSTPYTARVDLVWRDKLGSWIIDHKFVGRIEKKTIRRYTLSGQFLGLQVLGRRALPDFAGVILNLVGFDSTFYRQQLDPAPWMLENFERLIVAADARMKVIEKRAAEFAAAGQHAAIPLLYAALAVPSEMTCYTAYGECEFFERCRWGK